MLRLSTKSQYGVRAMFEIAMAIRAGDYKGDIGKTSRIRRIS